MSFRYENYGTADLLSIPATTVEVSSDVSKFCSAFTQTQAAKCFDIPATKELWCKFDIYHTQTLTNHWMQIANQSTNGITGIKKDYSTRLYIVESGNNKVTIRNAVSRQNLKTILLHMVADATNGLIEVWVGGSKVGTYTGSVNGGDAFDGFYFCESSNESYFSNVIISDEEIGLDEDATPPRETQNIELFADTARIVSKTIELNVDTARIISNKHIRLELLADTERIVSKSVTLRADTAREVSKAIELKADTLRDVRNGTAFFLELNCDTQRNISNSIELNVDTRRDVSKKVELTVDTCRVLGKTLELLFDTERRVAAPVTLFADTARVLSFWILKMHGLKSVTIELQELTITDNISYSLASNDPADFANIGDAISGNYYNYTFNYNVVDTEQRGIVQSCNCAVDVDEILYTSINYDISDSSGLSTTGTGSSNTAASTIGNGSKYKRTSEHLTAIAEKLGKSVVYLADDFKSTMELEQQNITYSSLISGLFGWTSRIPHKMINCYFRGNTIYVIQRGKEPDTVDITNSKHTLPTIKRSLERITWSSEADSKTTITRKVGGLTFDWTVDLTKKGNDDQSVFEYFDNMLSKKTTTNADGSTVETNYHYKEENGTKLLYWEQETTTDKDGNKSTTNTYHTSLGQGQRSSTVYKDGEYVTSSVGNTGGDDSASSYIQKRKEIFKAHDVSSTKTIAGNPLIDPSFPLVEDSDLETVTSWLKWLNRKIRETVTMEIYDLEHVLDFSDLITFEGKNYHLQSNIIEKNERIVNKQTVSIVRWY